jgi:hypothetical protein
MTNPRPAPETAPSAAVTALPSVRSRASDEEHGGAPVELPEISLSFGGPRRHEARTMNPSSTTTSINEAIDIASEEAAHGRGGFAAIIVSGLALLGSLYSMWETTLKQPQINLYVSENIHYTRDPYGGFEVLAVPITIANGGARDSAVLSMQLNVKNLATGRTEKFKSTYMADAQFFGSRDDVAARIKRPKLPFAPLSVAGRGFFTGTVLFYRAEGSEKTLIEPQSKIEMTLTLSIPPASNFLDKALTEVPQPITINADVPNFFVGALLSGDNAPLKVSGL